MPVGVALFRSNAELIAHSVELFLVDIADGDQLRFRMAQNAAHMTLAHSQADNSYLQLLIHDDPPLLFDNFCPLDKRQFLYYIFYMVNPHLTIYKATSFL